MRVLVIAAHPDDEILGVGGTICKHIEKADEVYVCIVTKAYEPEWTIDYIQLKVEEQKKVDKLLNIKKRFNLDFPTVKLNTIPHGTLNHKLASVVDKVKPNIVYTHYENDLNQDHKIVSQATLVATRPPKRIQLLSYETLSSTEYSNIRFNPNFYVDIGKFINKKIDIFKIYSSEVREYPHPRSLKGIEILAKRRGIEIFLEHAEAFLLIRNIWS